ncbi:MAG: hypothetical protein CMJ46_10290 [Planctomyces sp.]|nr:hypothetical protein [Planctomyces sp.]
MPFLKPELQQILQRFELNVTSLETEDVSVHEGFSGAIVYRLETNRGPVALRRWPGESLPSERIRGLHRLLGHLRQSGVTTVAVPWPVADGFGGTLVEYAGSRWHCEPWLPGAASLVDDATPAKIRNAMHALAEWHLHAATFRAVGKEMDWFQTGGYGPAPAHQHRFAIMESWPPERRVAILKNAAGLEPEVAQWVHSYLGFYDRMEREVKQQTHAALNWHVPLQPCLRDVWHDHILLVENEVTGIIDPTATKTDTVASDLSRFLGSLLAPGDRNWQLSISAYEEKRPLSENEHRSLLVLYRSGTLLNGLSWVNRLTGGESRLMRDSRVVERLNAILRRIMELPNHL